MKSLKQALSDFAALFVQLQVSRHQADYDPRAAFSRADAVAIIDDADPRDPPLRFIPS